MVTFDDRWDGALQESGALVTPTGRTPAPRQVLKTRKGMSPWPAPSSCLSIAMVIFHYRHHHRHDQKVAHMDFRARGITY